ncbi:App1 family protein [Pedobacter sp. SAFR-022]|uniref:App1 family protein n=1 Tax=Pedobacter sp. SAFR-022 TaxID=3436861 RepID=UPI003F7EBC3A
MNNSVSIKVYHGYGHTHNLVIYGNAFKYKARTVQQYSDNLFTNILYLLKLFILKPFPSLRLRLTFYDQVVYQTSEYDGFFKFEWKAAAEVAPGWHKVKVEALDEQDQVLAECSSTIFVPHITQYAFISDIDDTIMVSHSATIYRRLRELFIKNPRTRKTFTDVQLHYSLLALSHTTADQPNPFFYVSSSEWNLYDYLVETFRFNKLPEGVFLLNQIKMWTNFLKSGKTGHEGKLIRVMRIIAAFPNQRFVFFGDNSQRDPFIYASIAEKYPEKVEAIYIRNIVPQNERTTIDTLAPAKEKGIKICVFNSSSEAMTHSRAVGLIAPLAHIEGIETILK